MATYQAPRGVTVEAGSAITIYRFIKKAADGLYDHSGAKEEADGVAGETQATVSGALPMALLDGAILKVEAGAAVSLLDVVGSDATGRAITHVSGVGDYRLGKALDAAGAAGEIIRVQGHVELDEVA